MQKIPLEKTPSQEFQVILDDQNCTIWLYQRGNRIYCDLQVEDTYIFRGALCRNRADIVQSPSLYFKGSLHFFDTLGENEPQWDGLGDRYIFLFVSQDEELPEELAY